MSSTNAIRAGLLTLVASVAVGTGDQAHAQEWLCGKCKRKVGSGPNPMKQCPHCGTRLRGGLSSSSGTRSSSSNSNSRNSSSSAKEKEYPVSVLVGICVGVGIIGFVTLSKHIGRSSQP